MLGVLLVETQDFEGTGLRTVTAYFPSSDQGVICGVCEGSVVAHRAIELPTRTQRVYAPHYSRAVSVPASSVHLPVSAAAYSP